MRFELFSKIFGEYAVPVIILAVGVFMLFSKSDASESFFSGAKGGLSTSFKLIPSLVLLIVGVNMFSASGALDILSGLLAPLTKLLGLPEGTAPLLIMRPISGSGTTAMMQKLLSAVHPDSFCGKTASVIMGSSDTIIYTIAMYFGSVGIKKTRHAIPAAFITLAFCAWLSARLV